MYIENINYHSSLSFNIYISQKQVIHAIVKVLIKSWSSVASKGNILAWALSSRIKAPGDIIGLF